MSIFIALNFIFLWACGNPFQGDAKKIFHKRILLDTVEVQWYYYSLLTNTTPDFVEVIIKDSSNIICKSSSIINVDVSSNEIIIQFGDTPNLYQPIWLPPKIANYYIVKDTSQVGKRFIKVGDLYFLRDGFIPEDTVGLAK